MTRAEYNSVVGEPNPLKNPMVLPLRYSNMLQNHVLLAADSMESSQNTLGADAANTARLFTSPLMVPENSLGVITDRVG